MSDHRQTAMDLARMSGVDVTKLRRAAARRWEARGLALQALARGDMAEALRIMGPFRTKPALNPIPTLPPTAAKETP